MRSILFTLIILFTVGFAACRKDQNYPDIKQYDQQQIAAYISANGITGMVKDTSGGDTTGTWYKMLNVGTGPAVNFTDEVSYVYTMKSFDGKYNLTDTIVNHYDGLLGHTASNIPSGLIIAVHNILKYKGGKMRVLIPSHLAYGVNGSGSGSSTVANTRVLGNQCLDYTIELIDNQDKYDDQVIQSYISANSLTGYVRSSDSLWYKIIKPGAAPFIDINSSVSAYYTTALLNHTFVDDQYVSTALLFPDLSLYTPGFVEGLLKIGNGGVISMLVPSRLAYGPGGSAGSIAPVPADACLRFEVTVTGVTD